jgi:hypothetical protein
LSLATKKLSVAHNEIEKQTNEIEKQANEIIRLRTQLQLLRTPSQISVNSKATGISSLTDSTCTHHKNDTDGNDNGFGANVLVYDNEANDEGGVKVAASESEAINIVLEQPSLAASDAQSTLKYQQRGRTGEGGGEGGGREIGEGGAGERGEGGAGGAGTGEGGGEGVDMDIVLEQPSPADQIESRLCDCDSGRLADAIAFLGSSRSSCEQVMLQKYNIPMTEANLKLLMPDNY